ncbi:MAG: hypothetical protein ACI920_000472 [Saprospiraceae bacterium]|jgi:hypothetical protein
MRFNLIKFALLFISSFLLFSCNDDDISDNLTTIFKGKISNDNGEILANEKFLL